MTTEKFIEAVKILAQHHSSTVTINRVPKSENAVNAEQLVIHNCVPAVVDKLKNAGFMLSMHEGGLCVDHLN